MASGNDGRAARALEGAGRVTARPGSGFGPRVAAAAINAGRRAKLSPDTRATGGPLTAPALRGGY